MYEYTGKVILITRINSKNVCLGADKHEVKRPLPNMPTVYVEADQSDLKALYDKGHKFITKKAKNVNKAKKSDTADDTGSKSDNDDA